MKKCLSAIVLMLFVISGKSQVKLLSMEDAMVRNRTTLAPATMRQLQFLYGTDDYVYLADAGTWKKGSFSSSGEQVFLTLDKLNEILKKAGREVQKSMPAIRFNESAEWVMKLDGEKITLDPSTGKVRVIIPKNILSKDAVEESAAGYIAYLDNHNLFISDGSNKRQVTTDGSGDIVYASSVHRDEFGISKGTFWSNNGKRLAFYRMDQSMVTAYPIIDWSQTPAKNENIRYPMAGDSSHHVTVGVYDAVTNKLIYLQTGMPADQYLTNIAWSPDDRYVFIAVLNRAQDHMWLNQYDASTGAFVKTLFEEQDEQYTEPLHPMQFLETDPSKFIWQSRRDGWNHLYLYDISGKLVRQLTKGKWEVLDVTGLDAKEEYLYYLSSEVSPITRTPYRVKLETAKDEKLVRTDGVYSTQLSSSGKYLLLNLSNTSTPRNIYIAETATHEARKIFEAADPLKDYLTGTMSVFTIQNSKGTPLYSRVFKPADFDSSKKYPVIVYWYGGPHVQLITAAYNGGAGDYWFQYMAERGFLVFTIDPRGSDNRGEEFEQSIFRRAGEAQMEDLMSGIDYLAKLGYADTSRMALFGWSYGGFMTADFMLTHPGIFKAAVAGGPVTDWRMYEVMYGERYMDTPQENPEGYAAADLSKKIEKLKGKLLLIHGLQDPVVLQQHSVKLVKAAVDKNIQVDYMIYPGHEHNVLGKDRAHLYQKVTDYLMMYLQ